MSQNAQPDLPIYYGERRSPDQGAAVAKEDFAPRRPSREYAREGNEAAEQPQSQSVRSTSLRSNPPSAWRADGRPTRPEEYAPTDRRPGKQANGESPRTQRRYQAGGQIRYPQPSLAEAVEEPVERTSGTYPRYAEDYSEAERGYFPKTSQDSRKLDDHPRTRDSQQPLNPTSEKDYMFGGDVPVRPAPFDRTFTQKFASESGRQVGFRDLSAEERREVIKLPWYHWLDTNIKNHVVAAIGELVGTTMFLFFAFSGTAVANIPSSSDSTTVGQTGFNLEAQLYIALCFGFSLMVNVWVFYRISGGLFNPAVTLALTLIGAITPVRALFVFASQVLGGMAAAGLSACMFPTALNVQTSLAPGVSLVQGVFIEALLTFELVFTIFMLAAEKHRATFVAPVGIGLALFIAELTGVYYTGGSLNPARSFGPCVVALEFNSEHWIYWVGPIIGAIFAVVLYKLIKLLQYEMVNPGQDSHE